MLIAALLFASAAAADPGVDRRRYEGCVNAIPADAGRALDFARAWAAEAGGGLPARQCEAMALIALDRPADAEGALATAAREAEAMGHALAPDLWAQAGNAALLAERPAEARAHFDRALARPQPYAPQTVAGWRIDRARAAVEQGDWATARADLAEARRLHPDEPAAWTLGAALARRQGDLAEAQRLVAQASARAGDDPVVMLEQAEIAAAAGDDGGARAMWGLVVRAHPASDEAAVARRALARP